MITASGLQPSQAKEQAQPQSASVKRWRDESTSASAAPAPPPKQLKSEPASVPAASTSASAPASAPASASASASGEPAITCSGIVSDPDEAPFTGYSDESFRRVIDSFRAELKLSQQMPSRRHPYATACINEFLSPHARTHITAKLDALTAAIQTSASTGGRVSCVSSTAEWSAFLLALRTPSSEQLPHFRRAIISLIPSAAHVTVDSVFADIRIAIASASKQTASATASATATATGSGAATASATAAAAADAAAHDAFMSILNLQLMYCLLVDKPATRLAARIIELDQLSLAAFTPTADSDAESALPPPQLTAHFLALANCFESRVMQPNNPAVWDACSALQRCRASATTTASGATTVAAEQKSAASKSGTAASPATPLNVSNAAVAAPAAATAAATGTADGVLASASRYAAAFAVDSF